MARKLGVTILLVAPLLLATGLPLLRAENIDPDNDDSQYAWAENVGWINAEPQGDGGPGMQVDDFELTGWLWGENAGWISLSCKNTSSCDVVDYGVRNDGSGGLAGYGWSENAGWINFAPSTSGVSVDPITGSFSGRAWGENVGWITFASTGPNPSYEVRTAWTCVNPPTPTGSPVLSVDKSGADALLSWDAVTDATGYDVVYGGLLDLRSASGDFSLATWDCLADNRTTTSLLFSGEPQTGDGFWFLVRGVNCGGSGTYDTGEPSQVGSRDAEIAASGSDCP